MTNTPKDLDQSDDLAEVRDAAQAEFDRVCEGLDGADIIGVLQMVADHLGDDALTILRSEHNADRILLCDLIEMSQSAGFDASLPIIIRALEIDEAMSNL